MDEQTIHVVAHYNSKTDQVYVNVFEDSKVANEFSTERRADRNVENLTYKIVDIPSGFADDTIEQWQENLD